MKPDDTELLVADSFLVDDGLVLAAAAHRARFVDSVLVQAPALVEAAGDHWDSVVRGVPRAGRFFPRVEVVGPDPRLSSSVRPAPPLSTSVRLVSASGDPRELPTVKGPDLARLGALRDAAARQGADEAVIVSPDGLVVEGNWSSLVWWRGDALCVVDETLPRLPGVTEASLVALATALGVSVLHELVEPADLDGHEVWALSSLHGPRIATAWVGGPSLAEQPGRLDLWRRRLAALRRHVG